MKLLTKLFLALLLFNAAMVFAAEAPGTGDKAQTETQAVDKSKLTISDIRLQSGNIIVLTDAKEVEKLVAALKSPPPAGKSADIAAKRESSGFWGDIKNQVTDMWTRVAEIKAFSLTNLYYLLGGLFATFILVFIVRWVTENVIVKCLTAKTETDLDDMLCNVLRAPFESLLYSIGIYLSATNMLLDMPQRLQDIAAKALAAAIATIIAWAIYRCVDVLCEVLNRYAAKTESKMDDLIIMLLRKTLKVMIVIVSILLIGQNILGLNITTLLAGAGIFGLAFAFAAQDTIANFFGSIMIILDKPFFVGDTVKVGDITGVIKSVGFRSVRIETPNGHMITLPNKKITEAAVENITARPYIKFDFNLTPTYDTTPEKMRRAMAILHEILDNHEGMNAEKPPKIFFNDFKDWSLNLKVIVWYFPGDWMMAMEWLSKVNMEILQRFNDEGIAFAFPTNTTYLVNEGDKKLQISLDKDTK